MELKWQDLVYSMRLGCGGVWCQRIAGCIDVCRSGAERMPRSSCKDSYRFSIKRFYPRPPCTYIAAETQRAFVQIVLARNTVFVP